MGANSGGDGAWHPSDLLASPRFSEKPQETQRPTSTACENPLNYKKGMFSMGFVFLQGSVCLGVTAWSGIEHQMQRMLGPLMLIRCKA